MNFATHYPILDNGRIRYGKRSSRQGALSGFGPLKREQSVSLYNFPGLAALYDASKASSLSINSSNQVQLWADISGNSATNCFCSDGAASNTATSPTVSITGNFTASFDIAPTSWTPAASHTLFSKLNGNSGLEILLLITTGVIRVRIGDGAAITNFDSTVATGASAYSRHTIGITYVDNTSVAFTYDGAALGTTVVVNKVLANGAATATIGTSFAGRIYSAVITGKYNFNPSGATKLATSFVAPTTGETWTINTSGDTGARISGERDLVQMTAGKRPVYLAYAGTKYGYQSGAAGDTYTAANASVTGNQTFSLDLQLLDYTPGSNLTIVDKLSGNNGFQALLLTTGVVRLRVGDGASVTNVDSTAANTLVDGVRGTLGITWTDGVGASFTQNGSALGTSVAAVKTLTNAATSITIGASTLGKIYSVTVGSVYSFAPSSYTSGSTFVGPLGNTWTLNGGSTIVTRTCLYGDGSDDYMKAAAFSLSQPETVYFVGQQVSWTSADGIIDGNGLLGLSLRQASSTPEITAAAGNGFGPVSLTLQTGGIVSAVFNSTSSSLRLNRNAAVTGNGSTNNASGFTLMARGDLSNPGNATASEVALYSVADSTSAQNKKVSALMYQWRIP